MAIVAGVDFGTLSVRVSLVAAPTSAAGASPDRGRLAACTAEYPLNRRREDPDFATQSHSDHMRALVAAMRGAIQEAEIDGHEIEALAIDTTGSSIVPVGKDLIPLDDYYLWCDHRAWREAAEITETAHRMGVEAIDWCGGVYSSEWGFSKLLHWLRTQNTKRTQFVSAFEHCDMVAAVLCGITDPRKVKRSVCAMGHKWLWNESLGGFPSNEFFKAVDPLLDGIGEKLAGEYLTSDHVAGRLSADWAKEMGLRPEIPIPVGAFDAHWDAVGAGIRLGDVVNVIGTSTCIIGISRSTQLVPGVCGVVPGSVYPEMTGIEAGLSATGDVFDAIARRAGLPLLELSKRIENYRAGETGLLRIDWDNGDRTVLVNPELGGITLGWNLTHTPEDELFAAIEGTAFHTRIILERMEQHGVEIRRVINGGGIPRRSALLNQVYASAIGKPILVPESDVTSLGSSIFAFLAAGTYASIEEAQDALCPGYRVFEPEPRAQAAYEQMFPLYRDVYFGFGQKDAIAASFGEVLPKLRRIAVEVRTLN